MTAPIGGFGGPGQGLGPRRIGLDIAGEGGLSKLMQQTPDGPSFADTLKRALGEVSTSQETAQDYIQRFPLGQYMPALWLAVGGSDRADLQAARTYQQYAMLRITNFPLVIIKGGGHQAAVWRAALPPLLRWMTPQLAAAARRVEMLAHHKGPARAHAVPHNTLRPRTA